MPVSNVVDERGFLVVDARSDYEAAVFCETLAGILIIERRNLPAQALLWLIMILAAAQVPDADFFFGLLALRLVALLNTRFGAYWLGKAIQQKKPIGKAFTYAAFALLLGGASWGLLLAAVIAEPVILPGHLFLGGGTVVGVSLIAAITGPSYRLLSSFLGGFVIACIGSLWWWSSPMLVPATLAVLCLSMVFVAFAFALSAQRILTSRTLVENRFLSEELAESLANAEFLAFRDSLTGLMNRRAFFDFARDYDPVTDRFLLFVDLDNFKVINDHYGHATGDNVLVQVSQAINQVLADLPEGRHCAARLGGDEFVLVLDCAERTPAKNAAEALRALIAQIEETMELPGLITTCSIGFSHWQGDRSIDAVLFAADGALYEAKTRGRNRVENAAA